MLQVLIARHPAYDPSNCLTSYISCLLLGVIAPIKKISQNLPRISFCLYISTFFLTTHDMSAHFHCIAAAWFECTCTLFAFVKCTKWRICKRKCIHVYECNLFRSWMQQLTTLLYRKCEEKFISAPNCTRFLCSLSAVDF